MQDLSCFGETAEAVAKTIFIAKHRSLARKRVKQCFLTFQALQTENMDRCLEKPKSAMFYVVSCFDNIFQQSCKAFHAFSDHLRCLAHLRLTNAQRATYH